MSGLFRIITQPLIRAAVGAAAKSAGTATSRALNSVASAGAAGAGRAGLTNAGRSQLSNYGRIIAEGPRTSSLFSTGSRNSLSTISSSSTRSSRPTASFISGSKSLRGKKRYKSQRIPFEISIPKRVVTSSDRLRQRRHAFNMQRNVWSYRIPHQRPYGSPFGSVASRSSGSLSSGLSRSVSSRSTGSLPSGLSRSTYSGPRSSYSSTGLSRSSNSGLSRSSNTVSTSSLLSGVKSVNSPKRLFSGSDSGSVPKRVRFDSNSSSVSSLSSPYRTYNNYPWPRTPSSSSSLSSLSGSSKSGSSRSSFSFPYSPGRVNSPLRTPTAPSAPPNSMASSVSSRYSKPERFEHLAGKPPKGGWSSVYPKPSFPGAPNAYGGISNVHFYAMPISTSLLRLFRKYQPMNLATHTPPHKMFTDMIKQVGYAFAFFWIMKNGRSKDDGPLGPKPPTGNIDDMMPLNSYYDPKDNYLPYDYYLICRYVLIKLLRKQTKAVYLELLKLLATIPVQYQNRYIPYTTSTVLDLENTLMMLVKVSK